MSIVPVTQAYDKELVDQLEELLADAKAGRLSGLAWHAWLPNKEFKVGWCGPQSATETIGALFRVASEIAMSSTVVSTRSST